MPESGHAERLPTVDLADLKRLELLAADAELRAVVDDWADLSEPLRAGILAMIRSSASG